MRGRGGREFGGEDEKACANKEGGGAVGTGGLDAAQSAHPAEVAMDGESEAAPEGGEVVMEVKTEAGVQEEVVMAAKLEQEPVVV